MRRFIILALLCTLLAAPAAHAADEGPAVSIEHPDYAAIGQQFTIAVTVSQAYIEASTIAVDQTVQAGWGTEEQSYFDLSAASFEIAVLTPDESLTVELVIGVRDTAPEKQFTIPLVFYGKAGECADGCVPFRTTYTAAVTTVDTGRAAAKEADALAAYGQEQYATAQRLFEEASATYALLGNEAKTTELAAYIADAETGVEAMQRYESGQSKLAIGNKTAARADFEAASALFAQIGNTARVEELAGLIAQTQPGTETPPPADDGSSSTLLYAVGAVVVVAIALVVALGGRKGKN